MPFVGVQDRLAVLGVEGDADFWEAVRTNLTRLEDARLWWRVVAGDVTPLIEDAGLCSQAASLLPPEPWDAATWGALTTAVKAATGAKGRALFHQLRLAITGQDQGPEMKGLLPLIGRARVLTRLQGETG